MSKSNTVGALEGFLHDVHTGESEFHEVLNVLGPNELQELVKAARAMEDLKLGKGERGNVDVVICPYCNFADTDYQEFVDPDMTEEDFPLDCTKCKKTMYVEMTTDTWFKTSKIKGQEDE